MKGVFFRPCPKCGRICNSELDMCEICSGKIAKPEPPKPIIPVVTPVVEPIVEEVAPVVEEQVATEEVTTEQNTVEETTNEEKQEEVVVPVIETKAPKGKGAKGLYALVAVLMLVIVALVVVIMQDRQPNIAVNNTTLQNNTTTSTTLKQETETTTEITEGTTVDNAGETLAPVTTTKKAQNTSKETTTKKNTSSSTKETTTKKITTTTTTEVNKVEFNPKVEFKRKTDSYSTSTYDDYYYDYSYEFVDYYIVDSQVRVRCKLTNIREIAWCEETFIETSVTEFEKAPVLDAIVTGVNYKTFDNSETLYTDSFAFSEDIRNCKVNDIFEMVIYIENEANVSKIVIY